MYLLHSLLAPLWHGGPVPTRQGRTHMPGWDQEPHRRLVLVEGYVAGIVSAESGHVVGLNSRGFVFCSRLGDLRTGRDIREVVELVLGKVGRVWQFWYHAPRGNLFWRRSLEIRSTVMHIAASEVMQITEVLRQCDRIRTIVWGGVGQDTTEGMIPGNPVLCLS